MKSIINQTLFCIVLLVNILFVHAQTYTPLPYFCGFENPEDTMGTYGWKFEKRAKTGHNFIIGNAVHRMGSKSMYVSADGVTPNYSLTTTGSTVVAYKSFYLAKGTYDIMFEYRLQGEEHEESDVMRVAFYKGNKPSATALGNFPQYALDNAFKDKYGKEVFKTSLWTQIEGQVTAQEEGYYYLVFLFKEDGDKNIYAPGPCIDNIQIDKAKTSTSCASKPTNILINNEATGIKLTWMGKASEYEIMYNRVSNLTDTSYTLVTGVTTTEYSIPYASIPEGVYNFRIRALCDSDTSMWIEKANHIVYDESKHCLNYMDFYGSGTVCEYGNFANAAHVNRIIDYGYESRRSIHTVHYMNDEYDKARSIDELPQFINVLKGDMSIVGPRPERKYFIEQIEQQAPYYCLLYKIRPGLTSWGPVKVGYTDTIEKMIRRLNYDVVYVENMSLQLDMKIIFHTIGVILDGKGK